MAYRTSKDLYSSSSDDEAPVTTLLTTPATSADEAVIVAEVASSKETPGSSGIAKAKQFPEASSRTKAKRLSRTKTPSGTKAKPLTKTKTPSATKAKPLSKTPVDLAKASSSNAVPGQKRQLSVPQKKPAAKSKIAVITIDSDDTDESDDDFKPMKSSKTRWEGDGLSKQGERSETERRAILYTPALGSNDNDADDEDENSVGAPSVNMDESEDQLSSRKNIRKIMKSSELAAATRIAEKEEEARIKRLIEKQKTFDGIHKLESGKIEQLILEVDPESKKPLIEVDKSMVKYLKPHQAEGIKFMYNACFESVQMIKEDKVPGGCILAHCMGLGKTLQSVAFMHTMLTNKLCDIKTVLVICPLSTATNWYNETRTWTEEAVEALKIHKLYEMKNTVASRLNHLNVWKRRGGVGILHYDMFRRLADPKGKTKMKESLRTAIKEALLDPGPDMVICDEGHLLKNYKSILSLAVNNIRTHRRIVLTGTPLQNNLVEYHTMMSFVKPNLLGSLPEFTNRFVNPIKNGQHADSTDHDVNIMKRRAHVLHRKLEGSVQRCDYSILAPYLPPKHEYIIYVGLSEKQEQLYRCYLDNVVDQDEPHIKRRSLLRYYSELVKVWTHPVALTMQSTTNDAEEEDSDNPLGDLFDDEDETSTDESIGAPKKKKPKRKTKAPAGNDSDNVCKGLDDEEDNRGKWWHAIFTSADEVQDLNISGKLVLLQEILRTSESIGDKVLVFSQFLTSLDIIESLLQDWDAVAEKKVTKKGQEKRRWRNTIEYFRIDGSTKVADRHQYCEKFNDKSASSKAKVFLISTKAGGLGINLHGANRVVIFDASWNPSQDKQSIFRIYRFGQVKPCYIYRLIARGTMEEKILRRQITKLSLSSRVVDEQQVERHFKFHDVNEMYVYDPKGPSTTRAVLAIPKDGLLTDLLLSNGKWIHGYEEFDSLLENRPDEGLTNEEKEIAWVEYRNEGTRRLESDQIALDSGVEDSFLDTGGPRRRKRTRVRRRVSLRQNRPPVAPLLHRMPAHLGDTGGGVNLVAGSAGNRPVNPFGGRDGGVNLGAGSAGSSLGNLFSHGDGGGVNLAAGSAGNQPPL